MLIGGSTRIEGFRSIHTCRANILTPPVPWTSTVWPGFRGFRPKRAFQLVRAAQGRLLASNAFRLLGDLTKPFSLKTPYWRSAPSITPPRPVEAAWGVISPYWWPWLNKVVTLSPFLNSDTFSPTSATSPAPSEAGTTGNRIGNGYSPCRNQCISFWRANLLNDS